MKADQTLRTVKGDSADADEWSAVHQDPEAEADAIPDDADVRFPALAQYHLSTGLLQNIRLFSSIHPRLCGHDLSTAGCGRMDRGLRW